MATYKLNIIAKHGKFHMALWDAAGSKTEPADNPPMDSKADIVAALKKAIESKKLNQSNDTIIFRGIGYEDYAMLTREVSMASF